MVADLVLTFGVWLLALARTVGAGTDAGTPWLREPMVATGVPIVGLFAYRLLTPP